MINAVRNIADRIRRSLAQDYQKSYAQAGEDLILAYLFRLLGVSNPNYLDIGAHHPTWLSNTYLFYETGSSGVCVEPDPECCDNVRKHRRRDTCLNIGVCAGDLKTLKLYIMTSRTLSTFSREEAELCEQTKYYGEQRIERVVDVPVRTINSIMREYFSDGVNLISIDVEGLDFDILREFNFDTFRPDVFCVETLRYQKDGLLRKDGDLIHFMQENGYSVYADTFVNTIFVNRAKLKAFAYPSNWQLHR